MWHSADTHSSTGHKASKTCSWQLWGPNVDNKTPHGQHNTHNTTIQSHLFMQPPHLDVFFAIASAGCFDIFSTDSSCKICASYQCLTPHLLGIMQTIAYSVVTLQTHIIWIEPQYNSVINNECSLKVCCLTDGGKGWLSGECYADQDVSSAVGASQKNCSHV